MPDYGKFFLTRKKKVLATALALSVLIAIAGARLFGGYSGPIEMRPAQETIGWSIRSFFGSTADRIMYRLGVPARSSDPSPFEFRGPDGNTPEIISTSFSSRSSFEEIKEHYHASCQELKLELLPPEDALAWEPDIYCKGRRREEAINIYIDTTCTDESCDVTLNVVGAR